MPTLVNLELYVLCTRFCNCTCGGSHVQGHMEQDDFVLTAHPIRTLKQPTRAVLTSLPHAPQTCCSRPSYAVNGDTGAQHAGLPHLAKCTAPRSSVGTRAGMSTTSTDSKGSVFDSPKKPPARLNSLHEKFSDPSYLSQDEPGFQSSRTSGMCTGLLP